MTRNCKEPQSEIVALGIQVNSGVEVDQQVTICASIPVTDENWQPFLVNELLCISRGSVVDKRN